jgi:hypothetical protein
MNMAVFWVAAPCSLVQVYRRFRGAWCLNHHRPDDDISEVLAASIIRAMMIEAPSTSEMSVNFYQTTRCNNPEDSHLKHFLNLFFT